jgi:hypothetical protein
VSRAEEDVVAVRATERWFVSRGLPHFVYQFRSSRDVWVAVVPIVLLLFVIEIAVLAPNEEYPVLGSIAAVVGGILVLVAIWMVTNELRGRSWTARPDRIGPVEVLLFVLGPALIPVAFGGQWRSAVVTAGINFVVLALAYLERRYAVVSLARWTLSHLAARIRSVSGVILRALPLLLIVVVLVFYTAEAWQIAHELRWPVLLLGAGLFVTLGLVFAVIRAPEQIGEIEADVDPSSIRDLVAETPCMPLAARGGSFSSPPLSKSERRNVRMVVVVSESTLVAIVGAAMFLFFVVLGMITVPPHLQATWIEQPPNVLFTFDLFGEEMGMTTELIKVAGFVASFSALQFTVSLLSDRGYEGEFLQGLRADLRQAFAVRAVYLETVLANSGA